MMRTLIGSTKHQWDSSELLLLHPDGKGGLSIWALIIEHGSEAARNTNRFRKIGRVRRCVRKTAVVLGFRACIVRYMPGETVPRLLSDASCEYFLEAPLIQDIRKQVEGGGEPPSEVLRMLLYYAENDAFP